MAIFGMFKFSFVNVWEPKSMAEGQAAKYSIQCLAPKENKELVSQIKAAIDVAIKKGISKGLFTDAQAKSRNFKRPLRDGDEYYAEEPKPARETCKGHFFVNAAAAADRQPAVVDNRAKPIMVRDEFYSGCFGYADLNFYPYKNSGSVGVAAGLNSVLKKKDGERLDGRQAPEQAFAGVIDEEDGEEDGEENQLT